jgi:DNA replication protein DnaC
VDELGYLPFEANAAHLFFQLVSRRYERALDAGARNRSVAEWGGVLGDAVVATAILDRLPGCSITATSSRSADKDGHAGHGAGACQVADPKASDYR